MQTYLYDKTLYFWRLEIVVQLEGFIQHPLFVVHVLQYILHWLLLSFAEPAIGFQSSSIVYRFFSFWILGHFFLPYQFFVFFWINRCQCCTYFVGVSWPLHRRLWRINTYLDYSDTSILSVILKCNGPIKIYNNKNFLLFFYPGKSC